MADILLVEDTEIMSEIYATAFDKAGHSVRTAASGAEALNELSRQMPTLLILDLHLPDMNGLEILARVKSTSQGKLPVVIVMTAYSSINIAVEAMRMGAHDFLAKPFQLERLMVTIRNTLETMRLGNELSIMKQSEARPNFAGFVGSSAVMQTIYRIAGNVAQSNAPVFITGESGTGKEVCAEAIHRNGPRRNKPFIALNCAALPRDLLESEIFGHVRGAFTGAGTDREGAAVAANGGTLFLDEICELDIALQAKLLRFTQTLTVTPVGSNRVVKTDVRLIAATNRNPAREVEVGGLREDLFYRLSVIPIEMPRLADRGDDAIEIAQLFLKRYSAEERKSFSRLSEEVKALFRLYDWPGNVRQLQNVIRNVVALNDDLVVTPEMLPAPFNINRLPLPKSASTMSQISVGAHPIRPLWQIERGAIEQAVDICEGNIPRAAALLEVAPSTIYRKRLGWTDISETEGTA